MFRRISGVVVAGAAAYGTYRHLQRRSETENQTKVLEFLRASQTRLETAEVVNECWMNRAYLSDKLSSMSFAQQLTTDQKERIIRNLPKNRLLIEILMHSMQNVEGMKMVLKQRVLPHHLLPRIALQARLENHLTDEQFASFCLLYEALDQLVINPPGTQSDKWSDLLRPIFDLLGTACHPKIVELNNTFQCFHAVDDNNQAESDRLIASFFRFSEYGLKLFKEKISSKLPSEQIFYTFILPEGPVDTWSPLYQAVMGATKLYHPVELISEHEQRVFVLPSFTMFQVAHQIIFNERHAIQLVPMLGSCTKKTIEDFKKLNQRIVNICMQETPLPKKADGHLTGGNLMFTLHDIYHGFRDSVVTIEHRKALLRINSIFECVIRNRLENPGQFVEVTLSDIKALKWGLIDGELHFSNRRGDLFGSVFEVVSVKNLWKKVLIEMVIQDMVQNKRLWKSEFNLTKNDLQPSERKLYESLDPTSPSLLSTTSYKQLLLTAVVATGLFSAIVFYKNAA